MGRRRRKRIVYRPKRRVRELPSLTKPNVRFICPECGRKIDVHVRMDELRRARLHCPVDKSLCDGAYGLSRQARKVLGGVPCSTT